MQVMGKTRGLFPRKQLFARQTSRVKISRQRTETRVITSPYVSRLAIRARGAAADVKDCPLFRDFLNFSRMHKCWQRTLRIESHLSPMVVSIFSGEGII